MDNIRNCITRQDIKAPSRVVDEDNEHTRKTNPNLCIVIPSNEDEVLNSPHGEYPDGRYCIINID